MPFLTVTSSDGVEVGVHELGGPDAAGAPILLLCHANGFCAGTWRPIARRLADRYRCIGLDLRGHGRSTTPDGLDFDWSGFADDAVAALDAGLWPTGSTVHGVGHSLGGATLLQAEARRPGTFRSLWLFEPIVPPPGVMGDPSSPNPLADGAARRRATFPSRQAAYDNYAGKPPLAVFDPEALQAYVEDGFADAGDGSGAVVLRCRPEWEAAVFRTGGANAAWEAAGKVAAPTLVVRGEELPFGPAAFAAPLAERLSRGQLLTRPDLGHFGPMQDPAGMAESIGAWAAASAASA